MKILSLNVNPLGGVPKHQVEKITLLNNKVVEDTQAWTEGDTESFQATVRAVTLFSIEKIKELQAMGHSIDIGTTGENITVSGGNWSNLNPGDTLVIGSAIVQLTFTAPPCRKIAKSFIDNNYRIMDGDRNPGFGRWCAQIIKEGAIEIGNDIIVLPVQKIFKK
jgi:MOSC domain-containing protein YiiM